MPGLSGRPNMRFALRAFCLSILASIVVGHVAGGAASAGPALDDDQAPAKPEALDCTKPGNELQCHGVEANPVEYGVGLRLRSVWIPKPVIEVFVARSAG